RGRAALGRGCWLLGIGGFPGSFGASCEAVDASLRLRRAGGVVMYEPAARVLHRVSASHGRPCGALLEQQSRNEERVFWRNVPAASLPLALPLHLAVLAGKAWRRWREGALTPFLRGPGAGGREGRQPPAPPPLL